MKISKFLVIWGFLASFFFSDPPKMAGSYQLHKRSLENIRSAQLRSLLRMKERASLLQSCVEDLIKKIEAEGTNGYYSINSDCLRFAKEVWGASLRLSEMKRLEDDLRGTFTSLGKKKVDKENN